MKNIGIITYHFAVNYGAMLQCYALKTAIEKLGNNCEVLNYISDIQLDNNALYRKRGIKNRMKNLMLLPFHRARKKRQKLIELFRNDYFNTGERIKNINELKQHIEKFNFDILISGSDQVWNPQILDFDEAFFYPFETSAKKIGFAVSIGKAEEKDLTPYTNWIRDFQSITVREISSCSLISKISDKSVESIVDPVLLLSKYEWERIIPEMKEKEPYVVAYFVKTQDLNKKIQIAQSIANMRGKKLYIISPRITSYNLYKHVISDAGPKEFLGYLKQADYVCTDSFHGTVFSAILNKQFITLERTEDKQDNRKKDILRKLGLIDRIHYLTEKYENKCEINYHEVNTAIEAIRKEAITKLREMVIY